MADLPGGDAASHEVAAAVLVEPLCCGEPMVHNSWTSEWECADALYALVDGVFGEGSDANLVAQLDESDLSPSLVATFRHWRESIRPDDLADEIDPQEVARG